MSHFNFRHIAPAVLVGLTAMAGAQAQQQQQFPMTRTQPASCAEINWNENMLRHHPGLIEACQEVVVADGKNWARFEAKFVRVAPNGEVIFSVRDRRDRSIEEVHMRPVTGQVAYIDNRPTPFRQLRATDVVNLYVPEGQYGFATQPGAPPQEVATVAPRQVEPRPGVDERQTVAARGPLPAALPATASPLPWFALGGLLSLLGGVIVTLHRRLWSRPR